MTGTIGEIITRWITLGPNETPFILVGAALDDHLSAVHDAEEAQVLKGCLANKGDITNYPGWATIGLAVDQDQADAITGVLAPIHTAGAELILANLQVVEVKP